MVDGEEFTLRIKSNGETLGTKEMMSMLNRVVMLTEGLNVAWVQV